MGSPVEGDLRQLDQSRRWGGPRLKPFPNPELYPPRKFPPPREIRGGDILLARPLGLRLRRGCVHLLEGGWVNRPLGPPRGLLKILRGNERLLRSKHGLWLWLRLRLRRRRRRGSWSGSRRVPLPLPRTFPLPATVPTTTPITALTLTSLASPATLTFAVVPPPSLRTVTALGTFSTVRAGGSLRVFGVIFPPLLFFCGDPLHLLP